MKLVPVLVLIWSLPSFVQRGAAETAASCQGQQSCSACLSAHADCAWCSTLDFKQDHCAIHGVIERYCPPNDIVFPQSNISVIKNTSLLEQKSPSQPVQVAPQHLRLQLRPHEPVQFEVLFRQAADYPLDLYYLMDLTDSMREDKDYLESLGDEMALTLRSLTKNFRVGFGSFVDKPVAPYVSQAAGTKENPCALYKNTGCVPAYGFRNHLNLTNNVHQFTGSVRAARVSANLDDLEGGLDALVQVATCADVIGWNQKSRKLIIYTSDGKFHLAGEGLLGGATKKNELRCQLDERGFYTMTTTHDYPSVEELDKVLRRENMNVVFAVTDASSKEYKQLVKIMKSNTQVESLREDSANILSVIKHQYQSITSRIELQDDASDDIVVRYRSRCLGTELQSRSNCTGIKTGDLVTFQVEMEAVGCPQQKMHTIHLKDALTAETVVVDVEILCSCDCERPEVVEVNSAQCSGVGTLQCGICRCPPNRAGWQCECSDFDSQSCRPDNSSIGLECSGRGDCVCGKCECHTSRDPAHVISGQYCQCDNLLCDRAPDGSICGGELRGRCECNQCVCRPGWTGDDCFCNNDTRNCAPADSRDGQVCNGKGDCVCGRCHCYNTERGRYAGLFCEDCPTCGGLCRTYQPCAECTLNGSNCTSCTESYVMALKSQLGSSEEGTICKFKDPADGCFYQFQYYSDDNGRTIINVLKAKECYEVPVLPIVLSTVGSVLFIGVSTLLLWRLFTYLADRREYAKFERDLADADSAASNQNQLYQSPITTYRVPTSVMATFNDGGDGGASDEPDKVYFR